MTSNTFLAGEMISIFFDIDCHCEHPVYRAFAREGSLTNILKVR